MRSAGSVQTYVAFLVPHQKLWRFLQPYGAKFRQQYARPFSSKRPSAGLPVDLSSPSFHSEFGKALQGQGAANTF